MFLENKMVDERISRAIDNDHTAAMKVPSDSRKHLKKKSFNSPETLIVCMLCKKAFKNTLVYRKHFRLHTDKTFSCQICGKLFGKKHCLQAHMQIHGKNQFQCHLCHKRFAQKGNLNQHLKFQHTKKPFKCNVCEKDFYQQEHLKSHMAHHNNERPFECELCHKSFNIKSSLQRHMNCHTGEKPFICDICNRGYTRRSVLMLHIQQVHENKKPFECNECHLCFSQKGNLQAHYRRKHLQPKSESKRASKDGKGKRNIKRQHSRSSSKTIKICINKNYQADSSSDDQSSNKITKPRMDNTSLHSYASKVKAIVNRGSKMQNYLNNEPQCKSVYKSSLPSDKGNKKEQANGQFSSYSEKLNLISFDTSSSCSLSDEAGDVGCSSSSSEDIPELNFPTMLEGSYDVKPLSDFDSLLTDHKEWEEFLLAETDNILSSTLSHYDMNDVLNSPSKSNIILTKTCADTTDELFGSITWADDCTNPLFTADDLDEIKDISSFGIGSLQNSVDIKKEFPDQDKKQCNNSNLKNHLNLNVQKLNFSESSVQA